MCVMVAACTTPTKQRSIQDMYSPSATSHMPVDNDAYYSQPTVYKGCMVINDAPSCGGG